MERYNIFQTEYKTLRALLQETVLRIKETCLSNSEGVKDVVQKIKQAISFFTIYQRLEDQVILSVLSDLEPAVIDDVRREQRKLLVVIEYISKAIGESEMSLEVQANRNRVNNMFSSFTEFAVTGFRLMEKNEPLLNEILWRYFSDKHLKDMYDALTQEMAFEGNNETNKWSSYHGHTDTGKAVSSFLAIAEKELPEHRFNKIVQLLAAELELY